MKILSNKEYARLIGFTDKAIDWIQAERGKLQRDILKAKEQKRPNEKRLYALEYTAHYLGELQNRILDSYWED